MISTVPKKFKIRLTGELRSDLNEFVATKNITFTIFIYDKCDSLNLVDLTNGLAPDKPEFYIPTMVDPNNNHRKVLFDVEVPKEMYYN